MLKSVSEFSFIILDFFGSLGALGSLDVLGAFGSLDVLGAFGSLGALGAFGSLGTRGSLGALGARVALSSLGSCGARGVLGARGALGAASLCIFNYNNITIIIIYVYIISIISITRYDNIAMKGTNNISGKIVFALLASLLFVSNPKHFIFPSLSKNSFG
jgi:hypothetical protein